jgi:hypothetical protein
MKYARTFRALAILTFLGGLGYWLWAAYSANAVWFRFDAVDMLDSPEVQVVLTESGFRPEKVRVRIGTPIVFSTERNKQFWPASNPHPSHTVYAAFDPERPLAPDETWTFVPESMGVWGFHDHLRSYFTGILYVEP